MADEDSSPDRDASATVSTAGEPPTESGDAERDRLRGEIEELRRQNVRLALELQVARERARRLEAQAVGPVSPNGLPGADGETIAPAPAGRLPVRSIDELRAGAGEALRSVRRRLQALRIRPARSAAVPWTTVTAWEVVVVAAVLVVAVLARFWDVAGLPEGFQGDEAAGGIVARQIREEGWIGPYSGIAAGSPTGFYYVVALSMALFDDEVLAIRLVPALFGALTVGALYLLVRRGFGVPAAIVSAAFLATLGWHVHYSRIAFPNIAWPLFVVLGLLALYEASRMADWRWWAGAGALFGLGVYTYNAHVILVGLVGLVVGLRLFGWPALGAPLAVALYAERPGFLTLCLLAAALVALLASRRVQDRRVLAQALAFAGAFLLVAFPMIRFAADDANDYFGYGRRLSVFNTAEWQAQPGTADKLAFVVDRYREYWDRVCCHPRVDGVDATGVTAVIPLVTLLLAAVGVPFAIWRFGSLVTVLAACLLLVMPFASALSVDYAVRRSLVVTVFVAMFAGIAVAEAVRWAWAKGWATRLPVVALVACLALLSVYRNLDDFFGTTVESQPMRWALAVEMVEASRYVETLPEGSYVYYFSDRWPWSHEIRRFFAPDARGEDRGSTFGEFGFAVDPSEGRPVFLFLDNYRDELATARALYPGGETIVAGDPENPDYVAYIPPAAALNADPPSSPSAPGPAATSTPPTGGRG